MSKGIPIIFINYGNKPYLYYTLRQARNSNPAADISLVGDESNNKYNFVTHYNLGDYFEEARRFKKIYRHISINPPSYTLFLFQKLFVLRDFLLRHNIQHSFYADSDLLIYCDITEEWKNFKEYDYALYFTPCADRYSPEASFWNNVKVLKDFCEFLTNFYLQGDYKKIRTRAVIRGAATGPKIFNDMCALHLFQKTASYRLGNTREVFNGSTFSRDNVSLNEIKWKSNAPYDRKTGVRYNSLHCQGAGRKKCIRGLFLRDKSIYFKAGDSIRSVYNKVNSRLLRYPKVKDINSDLFLSDIEK